MKILKQTARHSLENAAYNPKQLALIHAGAGALASLLVSVLGHLLDMGIAGTGGLSGIGLRAILSTTQSILMLAVTVLLPFWELGFVYGGLNIAKNQMARPDILVSGLKNFRPALRLFIFEALLIWGVVMGCTYGAYLVFMFTPLFQSVADILLPVLEMGGSTLDYASIEGILPQLLPKLVPLYLIMALVFLALGAPFLYRYRLARFALCEGESSALKCLAISAKAMKGRRLNLLKLDLSFWWYYLLQLLISVVAYGDSLLALMGVYLPIFSDAAYWVFYGLYFVLRLAVAYGFAAYVQTTYSHFYLQATDVE